MSRQTNEAAEEAAIRKAIGSPARKSLLSRFEHAIRHDERGLPIVWLAPAGTKAKGASDHWVPVTAGSPLICTCGDVLYPGPQYESYVLADVAEHLEAAL